MLLVEKSGLSMGDEVFYKTRVTPRYYSLMQEAVTKGHLASILPRLSNDSIANAYLLYHHFLGSSERFGANEVIRAGVMKFGASLFLDSVALGLKCGCNSI